MGCPRHLYLPCMKGFKYIGLYYRKLLLRTVRRQPWLWMACLIYIRNLWHFMEIAFVFNSLLIDVSVKANLLLSTSFRNWLTFTLTKPGKTYFWICAFQPFPLKPRVTPSPFWKSLSALTLIHVLHSTWAPLSVKLPFQFNQFHLN